MIPLKLAWRVWVLNAEDGREYESDFEKKTKHPGMDFWAGYHLMKQRTFREFSYMQRKTSAEVQMHLDGEGITKNYPDEFMIILGFYVMAAKLAWSYDCFGHYFTELPQSVDLLKL